MELVIVKAAAHQDAQDQTPSSPESIPSVADPNPDFVITVRPADHDDKSECDEVAVQAVDSRVDDVKIMQVVFSVLLFVAVVSVVSIAGIVLLKCESLGESHMILSETCKRISGFMWILPAPILAWAPAFFSLPRIYDIELKKREKRIFVLFATVYVIVRAFDASYEGNSFKGKLFRVLVGPLVPAFLVYFPYRLLMTTVFKQDLVAGSRNSSRGTQEGILGNNLRLAPLNEVEKKQKFAEAAFYPKHFIVAVLCLWTYNMAVSLAVAFDMIESSKERSLSGLMFIVFLFAAIVISLSDRKKKVRCNFGYLVGFTTLQFIILGLSIAFKLMIVAANGSGSRLALVTILFHVFSRVVLHTLTASMKRMGAGLEHPQLIFLMQFFEDMFAEVVFASVGSWSSFFALALMDVLHKLIRDTGGFLEMFRYLSNDPTPIAPKTLRHRPQVSFGMANFMLGGDKPEGIHNEEEDLYLEKSMQHRFNLRKSGQNALSEMVVAIVTPAILLVDMSFSTCTISCATAASASMPDIAIRYAILLALHLITVYFVFRELLSRTLKNVYEKADTKDTSISKTHFQFFLRTSSQHIWKFLPFFLLSAVYATFVVVDMFRHH